VKIKKLQIGSFGKFKDYELDLKDGFQIIYGKNEDGKSTIMAFVKMMFYSKLESGRNIDKNMRKKYQPWDGTMMNGAVEFENSGILYRLQKNIGPTPSSDRVELLNTGTGEKVPLGKNEEVGKRFFGFDMAGFERSVFISQIGSFTANGKNDDVAEKLISNLAQSGDENISQQVVMGRLNGAIEDMESKNGKKGILIDAKNVLKCLLNEKDENQMLENAQKENVAEYHLLETKINEQKHNKRILQANSDKNKLQQLTELINKITQCTELKKSLEKEEFPYESLKIFLTECNVLLEESRKTEGSLESLKRSIENKTNNGEQLIPIREEEYEVLKKLNEQMKILKELLKRIDEGFIPKLAAYINARNEVQEAESIVKKEADLVKQLTEFHVSFQNYEEEKNKKINVKENLIDAFKRDNIQWDAEKNSRGRSINLARERASKQSKASVPGTQKTKNQIGLFLLSGVIGIVSIILGIVVNPFAAIGLGLAVVIGVYAIIVNKKSKPMKKDTRNDSVYDYEQELQQLIEENEKEEELVLEKKKEYDKNIKSIDNQIDEIEKELIALSEKNNAYLKALDNIPLLTNKKELAFGNLKIRNEAYEQEKNYLRREYSKESSLKEGLTITALLLDDLMDVQAMEYREKIDGICNRIGLEIFEKLKAKKCQTMKEYEGKFLEYSSDLKNQNTITATENEYRKNIEKFVNMVNKYEKTESYEEAKDLIQTLGEKEYGLEKEKDDVFLVAQGMGYDDPSLKLLQEEAKKLIPSIEFLEETGETRWTVEELKQKQGEFAGENLEERRSDLQKKIRTPDKNISQIEEEIDEKEKKIKEKSDYFNSLQFAKNIMQEASDEMRLSFGPELNRRTAAIFKELTNGKYENMSINKVYDISIQSGTHFREWRYLSNGTIDQAYLALRLAITELISEKNIELPLFLDDVLMQYDGERLEAAMGFLADHAKQKGQEFQLIVFTCHQHIIDCAQLFTNQVVYM